MNKNIQEAPKMDETLALNMARNPKYRRIIMSDPVCNPITIPYVTVSQWNQYFRDNQNN